MSNDINKKIVQELLAFPVKNSRDLMAAKRTISKKYKIQITKNSDILAAYKRLVNKKIIKKNPIFEKILRKRAVRTSSGIAPVAVLTMPWPCPGKCAYCPTEKDVPQSYLSNEPAVMRAIRCDYNPYKQVQYRLRALIANGHNPEKIELIVIGGTWSVLPEKYKFFYIKECFRAANDFRFSAILKQNKINAAKARRATRELYSKNNPHTPKNNKWEKQSLKSLREALFGEQRKNEKTKYKIIGLTLETRPDYINTNELWQMRELGCTRVELGVQAIDEEILKLNKRGHKLQTTVDATKLLRDFGFKITYHIMPGLPGSTPDKDLEMFKELFINPKYQPDQIKFYPTVVTKGSLMYRWWKQGKFKPCSTKQLEKLIAKCKSIIPRYVRIIRLIRDIPGESIEAGNKVTNLRQILKDSGVQCNCIRCREAGDSKYSIKDSKLFLKSYPTLSGKEYFVSYESRDQKTLYGFLRLNLQKNGLFNNTAIIRELHVYGNLTAVGRSGNVQHSGLGKKLLKEAEKITKKYGAKKIAVISGVGVRNYYRKLGFRLYKTYLIKKL